MIKKQIFPKTPNKPVHTTLRALGHLSDIGKLAVFKSLFMVAHVNMWFLNTEFAEMC